MPGDFDNVYRVATHHGFLLSAFRQKDFVLNRGTGASRVQGAFVTPEFFRVLGIRPRCATSDFAKFDPGLPVTFVRQSFAERNAWETDCAPNRYLEIDGVQHLIAGFVPSWLTLPDPGTALFVLFRPAVMQIKGDTASSFSMIPVTVLARLPDGISSARFRELCASGLNLRAGTTIKTVSLKAEQVDPVSNSLLLLGLLALCVLTVTLGNVAQWLVFNAAENRADVDIRYALGASPWQAWRPQIFDWSLAVVCAGALSVLVFLGVDAFLEEFGPVRKAVLNSRGAVAIPLAGVLALLAAWVIPLALVALTDKGPWRGSVHQGLASMRSTATRAQMRVAKTFLFSQSLVSAAGIVTGLGLVASMAFLLSVPMGFDPTDLHTVSVDAHPSTGERFVETGAILTELETAGFAESAIATSIPFGPMTTVSVRVPANMRDRLLANQVIATAKYFRILRIGLLRGIAPGETNVGTQYPGPRAWVSESFAQKLSEEPVGAALVLAGRVFTIAGVVRDVRFRGVRYPPSPTIYLALEDLPDSAVGFGRFEVVIRSAALPAREPQVEAGLRRAGAGLVFTHHRSLESSVRDDLSSIRFLSVVVSTFGVLTLALATLSTSMAVKQYLHLRQGEIAIRLALGAEPSAIRRTTGFVILVPVLLGATAGVPPALSLLGLARAQLYGVTGAEPWVFATAIATVCLSAGLAILRPLVRAGQISPSSILRLN